jgi:hypothetical protein
MLVGLTAEETELFDRSVGVRGHALWLALRLKMSRGRALVRMLIDARDPQSAHTSDNDVVAVALDGPFGCTDDVPSGGTPDSSAWIVPTEPWVSREMRREIERVVDDDVDTFVCDEGAETLAAFCTREGRRLQCRRVFCSVVQKVRGILLLLISTDQRCRRTFSISHPWSWNCYNEQYTVRRITRKLRVACADE